MRKRPIMPIPQDAPHLEQGWLDLDRMAVVEVTSEEKDYPVESALISGEVRGWRAADFGTQAMRLIFDESQRLTRIALVFEETEVERTQEFVLRWSPDGGRSFREIVRQQWNFSPPNAIREVGKPADQRRRLRLIEEQQGLLAVQPAAVLYAGRQVREPFEPFRVQLRAVVQTVNVGRRLNLRQSVIVTGISKPAAQAGERRGRFSRSARSRDQHAAIGVPYRRGMHRLQFGVSQPPVQDHSQWEADLPPWQQPPGRRPIQGHLAFAVQTLENVPPYVVACLDALIAETGDLAAARVLVRAPCWRHHRRPRGFGVEETHPQLCRAIRPSSAMRQRPRHRSEEHTSELQSLRHLV